MTKFISKKRALVGVLVLLFVIVRSSFWAFVDATIIPLDVQGAPVSVVFPCGSGTANTCNIAYMFDK